MSDTIIIPPLSAEEKAQLAQCETVIAAGLKSFMDVAEALQVVRDNHLYREYRTYEEYCRNRWGFTASRARQLTGAMQTAKLLEGVTGVPLTQTNEAVIRKLKSVPEQDRPRVAVAAASLAAAEDRPMNQRHVEEAAAAVANPPVTPPSPPVDPDKQRVYNSRYSPVKQWMDQGKITPKVAVQLVDELEACAPMVRGDMLMMQIVNPVMVRMLNEQAVKKRDSYSEIKTTRYLQMVDQSIPIEKATPADLRKFLNERYKEHLARQAAERDAAKGVEPVELTLYTNDAQRNADILLSRLGQRNTEELVKALQGKVRKSKLQRRSYNIYARF